VSVGAGLVAYADNGVSGYGNLVVIVHRDGSTTAYAHLKEAWVTAGQRVARGQTVGLLGNTGLSHGPHLHFEWRVGGRAQNPVPHMVGRPGGDDSRVVALADR
jgi:murein DD-endopeptidase MepM/ murein hydrolase activator NlpD